MSANVAADEKEKEELDVIIIDIGTGTIKAGWAGEDAPRCVIPTLMMKHTQTTVDRTGGEPTVEVTTLFGHDALQVLHAGTSETTEKPQFPIERGEIKDLDVLQQIIEYMFKVELQVEPNTFPVLLTVDPLCSREAKEQIASMMFNTFRVPSMTLCNQAVLSLFSTGRTTGIILEAGEGVIYAVPVYEGFALKHAVLRLPLAGRDLTRYLMQILAERDINFTEDQVDIVSAMKEKLCAVKTDDETKDTIKPADLTYELPDGQIVTLDNKCRFQTSELLFDPSIFVEIKERDQNRAIGVHRLIYDSIMMCDPFLQKDLLSNIVLSGGTSMLPGFGDRIRKEINELVKGHYLTHIVTDSQRKNGAWIGGSMYASLETFGQLKITAQEYFADPTMVHKKYF